MAPARRLVREGYANFAQWCSQRPDLFSFVRYQRQVNSLEFVKRLIQEKRAYVVPGDHFGLDHHLRISYGLSELYVNEGLKRVCELLVECE